jgi:TrmH family RNA methyltransferase
MGSALRVPIASAHEPAKVFEMARTLGIAVAAITPSGDRDYLDFDWTKPTLLVVGSEALGLSNKTIEAADQVIRIEMEEPVESLNLAVSAGIVMFEAKRQNRLTNR